MSARQRRSSDPIVPFAKYQNMPFSLRGSNPTGIRNYGQRRIRKRISRHFASEGYPTLLSMSSSTTHKRLEKFKTFPKKRHDKHSGIEMSDTPGNESSTSLSSFTSTSTSSTATSPFDYNSTARLPHIAHKPSTSSQQRGRSLGLIGAARVRLTRDFPSFLSSSSRSIRTHSAHSLQHSEEDLDSESESHRFPYPDYATSLPASVVDLHTPSMENSKEERAGRSFGSRLVEFLARSASRSRSKKRRSRSLDGTPVHDISIPTQGGSLGRRSAKSTSSGDHDPSTSSSAISKPVTRSKSRPLSSTTIVTNPTIKPRQPTTTTTEHKTEFIDPSSSQSSRKTKMRNLFHIPYPLSRRNSVSEPKSKSRPTSPHPHQNGSSSADRGIWTGRFRSGSNASARSNHEDRRAKTPIPSDRHGRNEDSEFACMEVTPKARLAPIHVLNSPRHPRGEHYHSEPDDRDVDDFGGRCSPICGWNTSKSLGSTSREKGKERERSRGAKDREQSASRDRSNNEKGKERITAPRRVGSPIPRESRVAIGAQPMEKVPSSGGAKRSSSKDTTGGTTITVSALQAKRIKHGSFDFERPVSSKVDTAGNAKVSFGNVSLPPHAYPMQRSVSLKGTNRPSRSDNARSKANDHPLPPTPADLLSSSKSKARPHLDLSTGAQLVRRGTDSSANSSSQNHHHSDGDPISPTTSTHSGHSSSIGRGAGKKILRASHGPFKFEPAVPPIPGSPADERRASVIRQGCSSPTPASPTKPRPEQRPTSAKGRSLDLGIGLSWAPTRVREEAVLSYGSYGGRRPQTAATTSRARARWRGGGVDEEGRLADQSSGAASDVAVAFKEALGDAAYATFKTYVHRFDAHAIPLDGPYGLISHAKRLLDSTNCLDEKGKQALLDRFVRFVRENQ